MDKEEKVETEEMIKEDTEVSSDSSSVFEVEVNDEEKFVSLDEEQELSDWMSEESLANFKSKMEAKVAAEEARAQEAEDKYLRTHADFENVKKRLEKEKYNAIDYASERFAKDLLAPIDALQMAIISANGDFDAEQIVEKLKEGIELTVKAFNKAFEKHDITEVEYDEFNPEYHNAVMQADSDEIESGQIVMIMQKGYKFKERLLREAMVSVAN